MRLFYLNRLVDKSQVSGTGIVAEGVVFSNGKCVLSWLSEHPSVAIYESITEVEKIHGHDGLTKIVFLDDPNSPSKRKKIYKTAPLTQPSSNFSKSPFLAQLIAAQPLDMDL